MKKHKLKEIFDGVYYRKESKWFPNKILTTDEIISILQSVKEAYPRIVINEVIISEENSGIGVWTEDRELVIGFGLRTLIHELAHCVIDFYYDGKGHHRSRQKIISKRLHKIAGGRSSSQKGS